MQTTTETEKSRARASEVVREGETVSFSLLPVNLRSNHMIDGVKRTIAALAATAVQILVNIVNTPHSNTHIDRLIHLYTTENTHLA